MRSLLALLACVVCQVLAFELHSSTWTRSSLREGRSQQQQGVSSRVASRVNNALRPRVGSSSSGSGSGRAGGSSTALRMSDSSTTNNPYYQGLDAYQILEAPRGSDKKTIKSAYRKMVAKWHPDKFPDDEVKKKEGGLRMEKINRAYYCLEDDDRRRRYDQYGEQGVGTSASSEEQIRAAGGPGMGGFGGPGGGQVDVQDISDIFDAFFGGAQGGAMGGRGGGGGGRGGGFGGGARARNGPIAGDDLQIEVEIPFMTAVFGGTEKVRVRRLEECLTCTGSGIKPGAKARTCSTCGGQGAVNNMQRTPFGVFNNVATCPNCRGSGQEIDEYCPTCKGKASTTETKEVVVRVPAGIEAGTSLRVRDAGNAGRRGGPRGDLFVQVQIKRDARFKREGNDIYTDEEINYADAILGVSIKAETVDGKIDVSIPTGTQPEQKLRLRGKGVTKLGTDTRGDQFITVKVKIPTSVSGKEKELIESIRDMSAEKKKDKGFFSNPFGGASDDNKT